MVAVALEVSVAATDSDRDGEVVLLQVLVTLEDLHAHKEPA